MRRISIIEGAIVAIIAALFLVNTILFLIPAPPTSYIRGPTLLTREQLAIVGSACLIYSATDPGKMFPSSLEDIPESILPNSSKKFRNPLTDNDEDWEYFPPDFGGFNPDWILLGTPSLVYDFDRDQSDRMHWRFISRIDGSILRVTEQEYEQLIQTQSRPEKEPKKKP